MPILGGGIVFRALSSPGLGVGLVLSCASLLASLPALATYSLLAIEPGSAQVGVAVASCVGAFDLAPLFRVVPGVGAVQTQAHYSFYVQQQLARLLAEGVAPDTALGLVTDAAFDPRRALRQYAVVDRWARARAFTGPADGAWAGDVQGQYAGVTFSAQGNLLTGVSVLNSLVSGASSEQACDLSERLMLAMQGVGASPGQGDARCTPRGISANSAYLRVADLNGSTLVELNVRATGDRDAVLALTEAYEAFRAAHPCGSLQSPPVPCPAPTAVAAAAPPRGSLSSEGWACCVLATAWALRRKRSL